jgi:hypothetical protein
MRLVRFENTNFDCAISLNPLQITHVEQNKKKPDTTKITTVNIKITVNYDYKTTCEMIDDAMKA